MYRIDGDRIKAETARKELMTLAEFPEWSEGVSLTTAESTFAAALGYDWLYDILTPEERSTVRRAIVEKGLTAEVQHYDKHLRWYARRNNWNQVCNAGLTAGGATPSPMKSRRSRGRYFAGLGNQFSIQ